MYYFYLVKNSLLNGEVVIIMQVETAIENYKEIKNFGELVEYSGDTIPNDWEYDPENDVLYSKSEKPSPFHKKMNGEWKLTDEEGYKKYCYENIDEIKKEILEYGFDYEINQIKHRQRCRDKDIVYMAITALMMFFVKTFLQKEIKKTWYFEDNHGESMDLMKLIQLMFFGGTFVQSVYDTENYFKTLENILFITKKDFEEKRKEIHKKLAEA